MGRIPVILTLQPAGGLFGLDHQTIEHNSKLNLAPPNLVTFSFYLLGTFWQNFSKISSPGGCCSCFINEMSRKLEHMTFLFCSITRKMRIGYNFEPGKMFSGIKSDFPRILVVSSG